MLVCTLWAVTSYRRMTGRAPAKDRGLGNKRRTARGRRAGTRSGPGSWGGWRNAGGAASRVTAEPSPCCAGVSLGHAGVGVLHLPAPVHRRRGIWLVPGENLAERRAYVLQLGLRRRAVQADVRPFGSCLWPVAWPAANLSSRPPNPREWLPGPWSAEPIRCDGPEGRHERGGRLPTRTGQGRAVRRDLRRPISTLDDVGFQARGEGGSMSRGTTR
jgi:hypothetical protein